MQKFFTRLTIVAMLTIELSGTETRAKCLRMIRWMQAEQKLWQFDPDTEEKLITYHAENHGAAELLEHVKRANYANRPS